MTSEGYERPIRSRYVDPYEVIWLATARRFGLHIRRDPDVFSMTDGEGLLALAPRDTLDPDDTLGQQVLHELCHWLVAGPDSIHQRDWGYELEVPYDDPREHACLRVQAALTTPHGLRTFMAPTGIYRGYYDALPADLLQPIDMPEEDRTLALTRPALERARQERWARPLQAALAATAALKATATPFLDDYATEVEDDILPSLWSR